MWFRRCWQVLPPTIANSPCAIDARPGHALGDHYCIRDPVVGCQTRTIVLFCMPNRIKCILCFSDVDWAHVCARLWRCVCPSRLDRNRASPRMRCSMPCAGPDVRASLCRARGPRRQPLGRKTTSSTCARRAHGEIGHCIPIQQPKMAGSSFWARRARVFLLKPIGCPWSYLAWRIGHCIPIW
jgi:hypothetical protein